jgi:hypothetical protein
MSIYKDWINGAVVVGIGVTYFIHVRKYQCHRYVYNKLLAEIKQKDSKIYALKSQNSDEIKNVVESLYGEKDFSDVRIICGDGEDFLCHKVVLGCQSEVFKTIFKNKSLMEKQSEGVMKIEENDINSDTMEHLLHYFYFQKVKEDKVINADLMIAADKFNVKSLLDVCTKFLKLNLSVENALDVLIKAELVNQKTLFDAASKFVCKNIGKLNKTRAWVEMSKRNPALIVNLFSQMSDME